MIDETLSQFIRSGGVLGDVSINSPVDRVRSLANVDDLGRGSAKTDIYRFARGFLEVTVKDGKVRLIALYFDRGDTQRGAAELGIAIDAPDTAFQSQEGLENWLTELGESLDKTFAPDIVKVGENISASLVEGKLVSLQASG